jgi:hypothetical protein
LLTIESTLEGIFPEYQFFKDIPVLESLCHAAMHINQNETLGTVENILRQTFYFVLFPEFVSSDFRVSFFSLFDEAAL